MTTTKSYKHLQTVAVDIFTFTVYYHVQDVELYENAL